MSRRFRIVSYCENSISILLPLHLILKLTIGNCTGVNARVFTRVSDTWCDAHCFPFLSNSASVCQRPSERAHTHSPAPLTHSGTHAGTDARARAHTHIHTQARSVGPGKRGKERGEPVFIWLQLLSLILLVFLSLHIHQCEDFIPTVTVITTAVPN